MLLVVHDESNSVVFLSLSSVRCFSYFCIFVVLYYEFNIELNRIESTHFIHILLPKCDLVFPFLFLLKLCLFFPGLFYGCCIVQKDTILGSVEWQGTNLPCKQMHTNIDILHSRQQHRLHSGKARQGKRNSHRTIWWFIEGVCACVWVSAVFP